MSGCNHDYFADAGGVYKCLSVFQQNSQISNAQHGPAQGQPRHWAQGDSNHQQHIHPGV